MKKLQFVILATLLAILSTEHSTASGKAPAGPKGGAKPKATGWFSSRSKATAEPSVANKATMATSTAATRQLSTSQTTGQPTKPQQSGLNIGSSRSTQQAKQQRSMLQAASNKINNALTFSGVKKITSNEAITINGEVITGTRVDSFNKKTGEYIGSKIIKADGSGSMKLNAQEQLVEQTTRSKNGTKIDKIDGPTQTIEQSIVTTQNTSMNPLVNNQKTTITNFRKTSDGKGYDNSYPDSILVQNNSGKTLTNQEFKNAIEYTVYEGNTRNILKTSKMNETTTYKKAQDTAGKQTNKSSETVISDPNNPQAEITTILKNKNNETTNTILTNPETGISTNLNHQTNTLSVELPDGAGKLNYKADGGFTLEGKTEVIDVHYNTSGEPVVNIYKKGEWFSKISHEQSLRNDGLTRSLGDRILGANKTSANSFFNTNGSLGLTTRGSGTKPLVSVEKTPDGSINVTGTRMAENNTLQNASLSSMKIVDGNIQISMPQSSGGLIVRSLGKDGNISTTNVTRIQQKSNNKKQAREQAELADLPQSTNPIILDNGPTPTAVAAEPALLTQTQIHERSASNYYTGNQASLNAGKSAQQAFYNAQPVTTGKPSFTGGRNSTGLDAAIAAPKLTTVAQEPVAPVAEPAPQRRLKRETPQEKAARIERQTKEYQQNNFQLKSAKAAEPALLTQTQIHEQSASNYYTGNQASLNVGKSAQQAFYNTQPVTTGKPSFTGGRNSTGLDAAIAAPKPTTVAQEPVAPAAEPAPVQTAQSLKANQGDFNLADFYANYF